MLLAGIPGGIYGPLSEPSGSSVADSIASTEEPDKVVLKVFGPPWELSIRSSQKVPHCLKLAIADAIKGRKPLIPRNPAARSWFKTEKAAQEARKKTLSLVENIVALLDREIRSGMMPTRVVVNSKEWETAREYGRVDTPFASVFLLDQEILDDLDVVSPGGNILGESFLKIDYAALLRAHPDNSSSSPSSAANRRGGIIDKLTAMPIGTLDVTLGSKTSVETRPMTNVEREDLEDVLGIEEAKSDDS
jgi:hypothetical protein